MSRLQSVRIQRFKKILDAPFDLREINILVGANNAGKSSVIQALHFGIGVLQTIKLTQSPRRGATSLNPTQLIYSPSDSIYSLGPGGKLMEDQEQAIEVQYSLTSGESCAVQIRKGRNRNINVTVKNTDVATSLANLEEPFSIFSPGLAGIATPSDKRGQRASTFGATIRAGAPPIGTTTATPRPTRPDNTGTMM